MKRTPFRRKPISEQKPMRRTPLAKKSSRKPKKTNRMRKMMLKRDLILQYDIPNVECRRYGTTKGATRQDILKGILWNIFSRYIRHRDAGVCISCGLPKSYEELQAGHFAPAGGQNLDLCFSPKNVNGECASCNADFEQNGWHINMMRPNLVKKWGKKEVESIERQKEMKLSTKWEETEYVQRIHYYQDKLKSYEK